MKRKAGNPATGGKKPKTTLSSQEVRKRFRAGLFDASVRSAYTKEYAASAPYKHAVIHDLVDDTLLRSVRDEIRSNVHFTVKETDIYKIHQSGDLANLDGLDDESLAKLPSLLALRDAIYSESFRSFVSAVTCCGPLSGRKTDMAINVYTPGCHLLCHDDVIGSRHVSYILYLTDPDRPWKPEWGGTLRLFSVQKIQGRDGEVAKTPLPDAVKVIPPAWNQLSFFAVQPGESFHDVEEVYHADTKAQQDADGGRVRMAISGWFHIPQIGEEGYFKGEEDRMASNSSLMQLQGDPAQYDLPQIRPVKVENRKAIQGDFDEADLEFLLRYISPTYLTPDTLERVRDHFAANSCIAIGHILSKSFTRRLNGYVIAQERQLSPSKDGAVKGTGSPWKVARPPHKHRYLYLQATASDQLRRSQEESPITELLDTVMPSRQFRQWLRLATNLTVESSQVIARRFRRGQDYTLATSYDGKPRLEINLGITPTPGWGNDEDCQLESEAKTEARTISKKKNTKTDKVEADSKKAKAAWDEENGNDVGGQEVYMAGDEDDDDNDDAAVYKSSSGEEHVLFYHAAAWNKLTMVLRDGGTLNFVKYVSRKAKGDRWDISGVFDVDCQDDDETEAGDKENCRALSESEEEFNGFSDSVNSDNG